MYQVTFTLTPSKYVPTASNPLDKLDPGQVHPTPIK